MLFPDLLSPLVTLNLKDFTMYGAPVVEQTRTVAELADYFLEASEASKISGSRVVYKVQAWQPVKEGTAGGLFFGVSTVMAGKVGREYFMTKGHFHAQSDRGEYYWGVQGQGYLILMNRQRQTRAEQVFPGSLHYIPGDTAHRLANVGEEALIVGACWPADAGYDYHEITKNGFSARLLDLEGSPRLIDLKDLHE